MCLLVKRWFLSYDITSDRKTEINWTSLKNQASYASNDTTENVKRQPTECRKYLQVIYVLKDLYPNIYMRTLIAQ